MFDGFDFGSMGSNDRTISVIICTYSMTRYDDTLEAVNSILNQSYKNYEIIIVVDRNVNLYKELKDNMKNDKVMIVSNINEGGLSGSRNVGVEKSTGEIIAFLDDDAIADQNWLHELVKLYNEKDVIGVGGPIRPKWLDNKEPKWIPKELYWTMGCTYKGFNNHKRCVRSNFGSNMSFLKRVFDGELFNTSYGLIGKNGVGEETEFSIRIKKKYKDCKIIYNPDAVVYHKIFKFRKSIKHILKRCYEYGLNYGSLIRSLPDYIEQEDQNMQKYILQCSYPERLYNIIKGRNVFQNLVEIVVLSCSLLVIILGIIKGELCQILKRLFSNSKRGKIL